jgi:large subunit ribosomal protein L18
MTGLNRKIKRQKRRKMRVRRKVQGTAARPRVSVFKGNRNLYVQAIDDDGGVTLAAVSTMGGDTKGLKVNVADAEKVGQALGAQLKNLSVEKAVFDRNGNLYHGVVKAVADGIRKSGVTI